ncbi:MAG: hypothetical protein Q9222_005681 [Ikaeria aurantiellina]
MAPVLKILVEWLPSLPTTLRLPSHGNHANPLTSSQRGPSQATPTAVVRCYVFVVEDKNLTHKYWDGYQWQPPNPAMETLGSGLVTPPSAVSWNVDRLDVFGLNAENRIVHQYWDSREWRPSPTTFDELGGQCDPDFNLAVSSWGEGRIDVFCRALGSAHLFHQYYDGTAWSGIEDFGYYLQQEPTVLTGWGKDRIDVFFLNGDSQITHLYWAGDEWREESEIFASPNDYKWDTLTTSSWGKGRLNLFAAGPKSGLWHMFYDGYQWNQWESLSGSNDEAVGQVSVATWPNHFEVVVESRYQKYYLYKYYDESTSWQPSVDSWYEKSQSFIFDSKPSVVSWSPGRVDIFGQTSGGYLMHQAWTGSDWYPSATTWEFLNHKAEAPGSTGGMSKRPVPRPKVACSPAVPDIERAAFDKGRGHVRHASGF